MWEGKALLPRMAPQYCLALPCGNDNAVLVLEVLLPYEQDVLEVRGFGSFPLLSTYPNWMLRPERSHFGSTIGTLTIILPGDP
jgi:hypothetical protein